MSPQLTWSEGAQSLLENVVFRVAEHKGGDIIINDLMPYLPLSAKLLSAFMATMVDDQAIRTGTRENGLPCWVFSAYEGQDPTMGLLDVECCVGCSCELRKQHDHWLFCENCFTALQKDIEQFAEENAWPAEAIFEHELLYIGSHVKSPVTVDDMAIRSRYSRSRMRGKLEQLVTAELITMTPESGKPVAEYAFPELEYPKEVFLRNNQIIRRFPAALMEDLQLRITRVVLSVAGLILGMLVLSILCRIPFPLMLLLSVILSPILGFIVWRRYRYDQQPEL